MDSFDSNIEHVGRVNFPIFSGIRIMMMPFSMDDIHGSFPDFLMGWVETVSSMCPMGPAKFGIGYVTIDESLVKSGEAHRRTGLHVDGIGPDGGPGVWGGGGVWGSKGMLLASSHVGCRGWNQVFLGQSSIDGDCSHLQDQVRPDNEIVMRPNHVYLCGSMAVHESTPAYEDSSRQFIRISMPNDAPWYEGYTVNPLGVSPTGPIMPQRKLQMSYRT